MLRRLLRITTQLAVTGTLVACFCIPARASYFDQVYACDDSYFGTLGDCRSNIFYPYDPTESQCRYNAGSSYVDCLNAIEEPMPELDFCAQARAANDNCILQYGPDSGNEDFDALMECRNASGIDQCQ